ncbi:MAG: Cof-type HAD-IIB family hydrolase [Vicinamibacterales bacterium]
MIRLIAIDIDGTLLDSHGRLPDRNRAAIEAAVARGVHVVLVTGRSFPFALPVARQLPAPVSLIVSNGALERSQDGRTLASRLLPSTAAARVLAATRDYRHCAALIFDRDASGQIVADTMDWEVPNRKHYWLRNSHLIARSSPLDAALTEDPVEVMFNGTVAEMRELAAHLAGLDEGVSVAATEYEDRDFTLLDVTHPEATKGRALAWRAREMGLRPSEVMAIGDNLNDEEMLAFAGCPVLMGNAVPALLGRGWPVTASHDDAGVAAALDQFVLQSSIPSHPIR